MADKLVGRSITESNLNRYRDHLAGELKEAFKGSPVEFGLYFSLLEWFHPLYKTNKTKYVEVRGSSWEILVYS